MCGPGLGGGWVALICMLGLRSIESGIRYKISTRSYFAYQEGSPLTPKITWVKDEAQIKLVIDKVTLVYTTHMRRAGVVLHDVKRSNNRTIAGDVRRFVFARLV